VKAEDEVAELRAEVVDLRIEARHARDREAAAKARLDAALNPPNPTVGTSDPSSRPRRSRSDADEVASTPTQRCRRGGPSAANWRARSRRCCRPRRPSRRRSEARQPLRLPGGVIASSAEAAEFLLRSDAAVLVDGYNVAKLAWPTRSLEAQRNQLLDAVENLARRFGADLTVVFDGASVVGAHAARRRLVRVVWSPEGVIADDVIRDEVRRLPTARAVVVVTNDAEIVTDVQGARRQRRAEQRPHRRPLTFSSVRCVRLRRICEDWMRSVSAIGTPCF
jgi:hypothetical protein